MRSAALLGAALAACAAAARPLSRSPVLRASALRAARGVNDSPYGYQVKWFPANVDNYNFNMASSTATFQMKYLYNDTYWGGPGASLARRAPGRRAAVVPLCAPPPPPLPALQAFPSSCTPGSEFHPDQCNVRYAQRRRRAVATS